jgi:hypothetical protein
VRVGVWERTEAVVIFLASSIPEGELDVLAIDLYIGDVVLEDGGHIDLIEVSQFTDVCVCVVMVLLLLGGGVGQLGWRSSGIEARSAAVLTSGKVPLEKTLQTHLLAAAARCGHGAHIRNVRMRDYVHEQTGLSTGAVADNNELSADFSHGERCRAGVWVWRADGEAVAGTEC